MSEFSVEFKGDTQNGILKYLYNKYTNKDEYYEEVIASANSIADPKYSIDFNLENYWHAIDYQDIGNYIVFCFKHYYINIKGFAITSAKYEPHPGACHPKNWGFDASNNNNTWMHQVNYTDVNNNMNRPYASGYFGWDYGIYKYFRFMITGEQYDGQGKNSIDLNQIEFFGDLIPDNKLYLFLESKSINSQIFNFPSTLFCIFLLSE